MVVSRIFMGLGNQMFQYAAGRSLSLHKKVPLKLETTSYERYDRRKFELNTFFTIDCEIASAEEVLKYQISQPVKRVWNKFFPKDKIRFLGLPYEETGIKRTLLQVNELLSPSYKKRTYLEAEYHYNPDFFKAPDDVFLIGYWMSWRYFEKFDKEIRKDFTVRPGLVAHLIDIEREIRQKNSVSVHIRRGDFTTPGNLLIHGVIPVEFYQKAIAEVSSKTSAPHLYVFSDDIAWVKENLKTEFPITFVSNEISKSAIEDFYLMTLCKHNIIANSTFAWWAAYLNNNPGKMVFAPEKWLNVAPYNYRDVYPLSWRILN